MNYQDYKDARDASWRILIDCEVTELPIRISGVCRALGVSVRRYTPAERDSNDGMSTVIGGAPTIMVSSLAIPARQRFTCAHELGHIILGHVGRYDLVCREPEPHRAGGQRVCLASACPGLCALGLRRSVGRGHRAAVRHQPSGCRIPLDAHAGALPAAALFDLTARAAGIRSVCRLYQRSSASGNWSIIIFRASACSLLSAFSVVAPP